MFWRENINVPMEIPDSLRHPTPRGLPWPAPALSQSVIYQHGVNMVKPYFLPRTFHVRPREEDKENPHQ